MKKLAGQKTIIIVASSSLARAAAFSARLANEDARIILLSESSVTTGYEFLQTHHIEQKNSCRPLALDADALCLHIDHQGNQERLTFDALVWAPSGGCKKKVSSSREHPRMLNLTSEQDFAHVPRGETLLVLGNDAVVIRAALTLANQFSQVIIADDNVRLMPEFSLACSLLMVKKLQEKNIEFLGGQSITHIIPVNDRNVLVEFAHGHSIQADFVLCGSSLTPKVDLLVEAGAAIDADGLIRIDDQMATTLPHVYACGFAVKLPAIHSERKLMASMSCLIKSAQVAGHNASVSNLSNRMLLKPNCPISYIALHDIVFARTGLTDHEARALCGDDHVMITTFFDKNKPTECVRLIIDRASKRLLGAELFGDRSIDRHVDLLTVMIMAEMSFESLLDWPYTGEHESDPLRHAAAKALYAITGQTPNISADTLALWLTNKIDFCLVDVSDTPMVTDHYAKEVVHIPFAQLRDRWSELGTKNLPIVICASSSLQSHLAQRVLRERGLDRVYDLDGGFATMALVFSE